ncbi:hypothetical protein LCGC14_2627150 [marine sediment metagenome]|uniref:Uncharacterized protein n=1 Tax=marine sediment metagenome TaxID=412755 RepID=A0A0F9CTX0_9ZZZZ
MDVADYQRFARVPTSDFSDVLGGRGLLPPRIRSVKPGLRAVGPCRTIQCPRGDASAVFAGIATCGSGEVLLITGVGDDFACAGELFCSELLRRGAAGLVVDGAVRDTESIRRLSLPVFASAITPCEAEVSGGGQIQVPVRVGAVTVHPGDVIVGDDDGIIAIPPDIAMTIIGEAESKQQVEEKTFRAIQSGKSLTELPPYGAFFQQFGRIATSSGE